MQILTIGRAVLLASCLAGFGIWSAARPVPLRAGAFCGVTPVKPVAPPGCRNMIPTCLCDSHGQNCQWEWICVR